MGEIYNSGSNTCSFQCPYGSTELAPGSHSCVTAYQFPPKTLGQTCNGVGNPCDASTGNKFQTETDFESVGTGLRFNRYYNSGAWSVNGVLGYGWSNQFSPSLEILTGKILVHQADGRAEWFTLTNGTWSGDADSRLRLTQDAGGYTLTAAAGTVERYDNSGRIQSRTETNGRVTAFAYDASQRLSSVTGPFGHTLQLSYDSANRISRVTYPDGLFSQYQYDAQGNLSQVVHQDGSVRRYHYENATFPHALTGITDENGARFATWSYDGQGRANLSQHADGVEQVNLVYNSDSSTDVTDSLNTTRHYTFQNVLNVWKLTGLSQPGAAGGGTTTQTRSYDANGNLASQTDFNGNLSCYAYDLSRNLETVRLEGLPPGSSCSANLAGYTPAAGSTVRKIVSQWHANYRLPTQIDEAGRRTTFSYDAGGNLLRKTVTDTATQQSRTWTYTYNSLGQILSQDGPRTDVNDVTAYRYYTDTTAGHHVGDLWQISNALGHTTNFNSYDANGRLLGLTGPNGLAVGFSYDARGRLTQKNVGGNITRYDYDPVGNLTKVIQPSGVFFSYTYDAAHRLTDITDALGGKIHYTLDAMGNRTQEQVLDSSGTVVKSHRRVYDALNRLAQDIGAYNQTTSYAYDANGNLTQTTDAAGNVSQRQYDSLDRLIRSTDALNGQTDYYYDAQDRLTQVTDAAGHNTEYSYNGLGDLTRLDSPNTGATQYAYDAAGNLAQTTDAADVTATYRYDALNRLLGIDYPGSEADAEYGYDGSAGNIAGQQGRLTDARRGDIATRHQFDLRGNLLTATVRKASNNSVLSEQAFGYDADDRIVQTQPGSGRRLQYEYDAAGQVHRIQVADTVSGTTTTRLLADNIVHLPFGPVAGLTYGNGLSDSRQFDQDYRLTRQSVGNLFRQTYGYDSLGNMTLSNDETASLAQQNYTYDAVGELTALNHANPLQNQSYQYDAVGNRTRQASPTGGTTDYRYDPDSQQLLGTVTGNPATGQQLNHFRSDARGAIDRSQTELKSAFWNVLSTPVDYVYAADQRLVQINSGSSLLAGYAYDAFGRRVGKTRPGKPLHTFAYAGSQLLAENAGTPSHYAYLDGQALARIDGSAANSPIYYFHNHPLGVPLKASNAAGQTVWAAQLQPFGLMQTTTNAISQNLRFPGQYFDAESGLHYNMARYYSPELGRYLQSDPIGLAGGINSYSYVRNSPLRYIDPFGLCATPNPSQNCLNALLVANTNSSALTRVNNNWATIQGAADSNGVNPNLLAAIGIRETGFQNIPQSGGGLGAGVFQIDLGQNPSVTQSQAYNISFSANFAANMLSSNMNALAAAHPNLNSSQLLQATAASYNFGTGNISGNPNTIDIGSTGNNYGSNVLNIMFNCFSP
ncbi:RHS repeat-associated core domain-containing protein [Methylomonas koyamae]|uniref:RHS repeat-associated core domain-containing protein n=1 Tax=Methylomonas koyamae TaxID=702114 RepID=UPI001E3F5250|nr:RHS repeat-associated core domain-containing protein [Methylomonas koyamae]